MKGSGKDSPISSDGSSSSSSNYMVLNNLLPTTSPHKFCHKQTSSTGGFSSADCVFESVPDIAEVEFAIASFQRFMQETCSSKTSTSDCLQHLWGEYYQRILQSPYFQGVYAAFHLLQTVPSVQKMVASITTDEAVWDAVLNNIEVQEFHKCLKQAKICRAQGSNEKEVNIFSMILRCILDIMKLKVVELLEILKSLVNVIKSSQKDNINPKLNPQFEELISSTVLLSIITLMIVLVTRIYGGRSHF